jgi:Glycine-rich domain-containing protein-like
MTKVDILARRTHQIDLMPIKYKLVNSDEGCNWSKDKANKIEMEYRDFLELCRLNPQEVIVPTKDVDHFWHTHILDTKKYASDCEYIFGYFLHHFPYLGSRGPADAAALSSQFARSKALQVACFGSASPSVDVFEASAVCGGACGGGGCGGSDISGFTHGIDMETRPSL